MSEEIKKKLASLEKRVDVLESAVILEKVKKQEESEIVFPYDEAWWTDEEPAEIEVQESGEGGEDITFPIDWIEQELSEKPAEKPKKKSHEQRVAEELEAEEALPSDIEVAEE